MYQSTSLPAPRTARTLRSGQSCDDVIALVARERDVPIRLILNKSRSSLPAARARQLAMYLAHVVLGRSLSEIGEAFGRDRTTVSHACALIEDLRDDPKFDSEVDCIEQHLEASEAKVIGHAE